MARYSPERKEAILKKMAPPHNMTVAKKALAQQLCTIGEKQPEYEVPFCHLI